MITRRQTLQGLGLVMACSALGARMGFAQDAPAPRLIVMILRGGLDGLAAIAPYADPHYARARGALALPPPGAAGGLLDLGGGFGLHPRLKNLHDLYGQGELTVIHAAATPYRARSHFDAQNVLEQGDPAPYALADGWLGRALNGSSFSGLAVGGSVPLLLQGSPNVTSWTPSRLPQTDNDTITRLMDLYKNDPLLGPALSRSLETDDLMAAAQTPNMGGTRPRRRTDAFRALLDGAATLMTSHGGAEIGVLEAGGWDTHANQGAAAGLLATRLEQLDEGVAQLKNALGGIWDRTVLLIVSEFGRTIAVNGTGGTDHGTGGAALLAGGAVQGGRVIADWPGLAPRALYEGRDLKPTLDLRSIFKGVLHDHLSISKTALDGKAFPGSDGVSSHRDLIRA